MALRVLVGVVALIAIGCARQPENETIRLEAYPPSTVQVDGVDVQAPGAVELSTDQDHVVVWPDGTRSLIEGSYRGPSLLDFYLRAIFGVLSPKYLRWEDGQGVVVPAGG